MHGESGPRAAADTHPLERRVCRHVYAAPAFTADECTTLLDRARAIDRWSPAEVRSGERTAVDAAHRLAERMSFATAEEAAAAGLGPWIDALTALARRLDQRHFRTGFRRVEQVQLVRYDAPGQYVCGSALTFPSWLRHRAAPVRRGRKHVLLLMFV